MLRGYLHRVSPRGQSEEVKKEGMNSLPVPTLGVIRPGPRLVSFLHFKLLKKSVPP